MQPLLSTIVLFALLWGSSDLRAERSLRYPSVEPSALVRRHGEFMSKLSPTTRDWIREIANGAYGSRLTPSAIDSLVRSRASSRFAGRKIESEDVAGLSQLVLMEVFKTLDAEYRSVVGAIEMYDAVIRKLRALNTAVAEETARNTSKSATERCASPTCGGISRQIDEYAEIASKRSSLGLLPPGIAWSRQTYAELRAAGQDIRQLIERAEAKAQETREAHDKARDRRKAALDNLQKFLDILNGMNPQL